MSEHKDAISTPVPDEHNPQVIAMNATEFIRLQRENVQLRVACQQANAAMERICAELDAMVSRCNQLSKIGGGR